MTSKKRNAEKRERAKPMSQPTTKPADTKDRILDAALETVNAEGLMGASARAIARTGDFNQALVFYHFGSVEELLLAALQRANDRRIERFRDRLENATDLPGLVAIATDLHGGPDDPDSAALSAIVAGWSKSSDLGPKILATLDPWHELVEAAVNRSLEGSPFASVLPAADLAWAISALFLGIEILARLDPSDTRSDELFASLDGLAKLAGPFLHPPTM